MFWMWPMMDWAWQAASWNIDGGVHHYNPFWPF